MSSDDREAILRRRAAFVAAALVGLATTDAHAQEGGAGGEAIGGQAGQGGDGVAGVGGGGGEAGAPQPCLSIAKNDDIARSDCECGFPAGAEGSGAVAALAALAVAGARRRRRKPAAKR